MPIAKSAPQQPKEAPAAPQAHTEPVNAFEYDGVPVDVFRVLDLNASMIPHKDIDKLKVIYDWAKKDSESLGDTLIKISRIRMQLGSPAVGQGYHDKIYNWVRLTQSIEDLDKRREALRGGIWRL